MSSLLQFCKNILGKESQNTSKESESKNMLIMLRLEYLLLSLYFIVLSVFLSLSIPIPHFIIAVVAASYMLFGLLGTYYFDIHFSGNVLLVGMVFFPVLFTVYFGYVSDMQQLILLTIPLLFSSIRLNLPQKIGSSVLISASIPVLITVSRFFNPAITLQTPQIAMFKASTIFTMSVYLIIISFYFCMKFTQAEHQLYLYNRQLKKMASLDPLTNLMNRRGMAEVLADMEKDYQGGSTGLSIALGDIDFFKRINDTYGHDCGDYILKTLADLFNKYMEGQGEVCRWGGEEFLFAFTDRNTDNVFVFMNDLRNDIKHMVFSFNGVDIRLSMTFGLEEYDPLHDIESTIKKADEKLYLGKESGRDKVVY